MGRRPAAGGMESGSPTWPAFWKESGNAGPRERRLPARPALPHPPPRWQPAKPEARAGAMPGGRGARPAQAGSCQPRWCPCAGHGWTRFPPTATGMGWLPWQDPKLECERASARGKLHTAPVGAGIAGGRFEAPYPRGLKDSPLPQGRIPLDRAPPCPYLQPLTGGV